MRRIKNVYHLVRAIIANIYFGFPSRRLSVIGITGTDGKTTTSFLLHSILIKAGLKAGMITTIMAKFGDEEVDVGLHVTSPDTWNVQKLLRRMVNEGMEYVVLEVTSHAIDQNRFWGVDFDYAGLTNVTHEHLDYHGSFENYKATKMRLITKATHGFISDEISDDLVRDVQLNIAGSYNYLNAKLAARIAQEIGIDPATIKEGLEAVTSIEGRMQVVYENDFKVIVDFAHTPNGLETALSSARQLITPPARLISVFGSAGERDFAKRPKMGEIAGKLADVVIITAEDPRSEDVNEISSTIAKGAQLQGKELDKDLYIKIDRREAIDFALNQIAQPGDVVMITGKGHEKSMNLGDGEIEWSDVETVRSILADAGFSR